MFDTGILAKCPFKDCFNSAPDSGHATEMTPNWCSFNHNCSLLFIVGYKCWLGVTYPVRPTVQLHLIFQEAGNLCIMGILDPTFPQYNTPRW